MNNTARLPLISIVLVSWNNSAHLPHCLSCLAQQTYRNFEVIIIDNGSTDGRVSDLDGKYPELVLSTKYLGSNQGFALANNIAARLARGHWLALLNADAYPAPDWLEKLVHVAEKNPECAFFASRQIQANIPERLDGAGDIYHISGLAWRHYYNLPQKQFGHQLEEVFSTCGVAALYLREDFLQAGGFDEDFFSYYEDVDLGFRLRLKSYRTLYVPEAVVHQIGSATFGERSDFVCYHSQRNLIWTFVKNMPSAMLWRYLPAHILANLFCVFYFTLHGQGRIVLQAKHDAVRELSKVIEKRRVIQKGIKATPLELLQTMERGWLRSYLLGYRLRNLRRSEGLLPDIK